MVMMDLGTLARQSPRYSLQGQSHGARRRILWQYRRYGLLVPPPKIVLIPCNLVSYAYNNQRFSPFRCPRGAAFVVALHDRRYGRRLPEAAAGNRTTADDAGFAQKVGRIGVQRRRWDVRGLGADLGM